MATYTELQDRVTRRLIDLPTAVLAEVPDLVNKAHLEIQRRHNFKVMEEESSLIATAVGTRLLVALPSDFKETRADARPYRVADDGFVNEMAWAPGRNALLRRFENDDEGAPEFLLDPKRTAAGVGTVEVWPLPDGNSDYDDGEYQIVVPYWKYLPAYSGDSDTDWFSVNADWYLIFKATAEGFFVDWDEQRAAVWEQKAANEMAQLILADKHAQLGGLDTLVAHRGALAAQLRG